MHTENVGTWSLSPREGVVYNFCMQKFLAISRIGISDVCHGKTDLLRFFKVLRLLRFNLKRSLLLSNQKNDGCAWPHPSFFWYDTDFSEFDSVDIIKNI